jgi:putative DNA primase/helicase
MEMKIMKTLETERLILRPFEENDFKAVHAYASVTENVQYMVWEPNEESHTKAFILQAIAKSKEIPCNNYQYAAVLKSSKKLIGAYNLAILSDGEAEIGWILHRDYSGLAKDIMDIFKDSYIEKSPSGKGIRIIFLVDGFSYNKSLYYINNQKLGLEVYVAGSTNKYVTITGDAINQGEIILANDQLEILLDKYMQRPKTNTGITNEDSSSFLSDSSVIEKATASATGNKFKALWKGDTSSYPSQSEADLALCSILAFWCGRDINQMDRLFQQSGLMRDKWHRVQSGSTYGQITLEKAIANTKETYSPMGKNSSASEDFMADKLMDLSKLEPFKNPRYYSNDIGNSNLFADFYKSIARYVPERKKWFVYDGKAWRSDTGNLKVMKLCKNLLIN